MSPTSLEIQTDLARKAGLKPDQVFGLVAELYSLSQEELHTSMLNLGTPEAAMAHLEKAQTLKGRAEAAFRVYENLADNERPRS